MKNDSTWKLCVHGQNVDTAAHTSLKHCPSILDLESANAILVMLDSMHICVGNPETCSELFLPILNCNFL